MPSARMVVPAPEEDDYLPSVEQLGREDSDSGESYAVNDKPAISTVEERVSEVDLEVVLSRSHHRRYDQQMLPLWARGPLMERPGVSHV